MREVVDGHTVIYLSLMPLLLLLTQTRVVVREVVDGHAVIYLPDIIGMIQFVDGGAPYLKKKKENFLYKTFIMCN